MRRCIRDIPAAAELPVFARSDSPANTNCSVILLLANAIRYNRRACLSVFAIVVASSLGDAR
jgi:hypothetical protein